MEAYEVRHLIKYLEKIKFAPSSINFVVNMDRTVGQDTTAIPNVGFGAEDWQGTRRGVPAYDNDDNQNSTILVPVSGCTDLGNCSTATMGEINTGDPQSLVDFVQFCKDNYPAEHYMLYMSGHGNPRCTVADYFQTMDLLSLEEIRWAVENLPVKIDVLCLKSCLTASIEMMAELEKNDQIEYVVCPETFSYPGSFLDSAFYNILDLIIDPDLTYAVAHRALYHIKPLEQTKLGYYGLFDLDKYDELEDAFKVFALEALTMDLLFSQL